MASTITLCLEGLPGVLLDFELLSLGAEQSVHSQTPPRRAQHLCILLAEGLVFSLFAVPDACAKWECNSVTLASFPQEFLESKPLALFAWSDPNPKPWLAIFCVSRICCVHRIEPTHAWARAGNREMESRIRCLFGVWPGCRWFWCLPHTRTIFNVLSLKEA
eukprot:4140714-Amphidinium_carterae.2